MVSFFLFLVKLILTTLDKEENTLHCNS